MKETVFVDTGVFVARFHKGDDRHAEAMACVKDLVEGRTSWVTSDYVVDETLTLLSRRLKTFEVVKEFGASIIDSQLITMLWATPKDFSAAWELFKRFGPNGVSFTDCMVASLMR